MLHLTLLFCRSSTHGAECLFRTSQVGCLSIDSWGELLVTGDESGAICARLLHRSGHGAAYRSSSVEGESSGVGGGGGVTRVVREAHSGDVLAVSHVEGGAGDDGSSLFVSGGKGEKDTGYVAPPCLFPGAKARGRPTSQAGGGRGGLLMSRACVVYQVDAPGVHIYLMLATERTQSCYKTSLWRTSCKPLVWLVCYGGSFDARTKKLHAKAPPSLCCWLRCPPRAKIGGGA